MANLRLLKEFQGRDKTYPESLTVNIDDKLLDDILSGKLKAKLASTPKVKAVKAPVKDKMIKGGEEKVEKKSSKSWTYGKKDE